MVDFDRRFFLVLSSLSFLRPAFAGVNSFLDDSLFVSKLKGFNISNFYKLNQVQGVDVSDFKFIAESGFGVLRIPFDYRIFFGSESPLRPNLDRLSELDFLINSAADLGLHVNLCMHRAPGYCVNPPYEKLSLWRDAAAVNDFLYAWSFIASRYSSIASRYLSFNLVNEPKREIAEVDYVLVMSKAISAVRDITPERVIVLDGLAWGTEEIKSAFSMMGIVQGARGYFPMQFSHHKAEWVSEKYRNSDPSWPILVDGKLVGRDALESMFQDKWRESIIRQLPVSIGEWGVYNKTPHLPTLSYMNDCLGVFSKFGWGWLLWNFNGPFGVVNSDRHDVEYTSVGRYRVDMKMLNLLQKYL